MNDKEKLQIKEDIEIRDLLIQESIIDYHRCGEWSNKEGYFKQNQYHKPYPTFCRRYDCRVCRRKKINTQRKKHYSNNIEFINRDGTVIMITCLLQYLILSKTSYLLSMNVSRCPSVK